MSKSKRNFQRSQNAHARLMKKHRAKAERSKGQAYDTAFIKQNYHSLCIHKQNKLKRILSPEEKKRAYNSVIRDFY